MLSSMLVTRAEQATAQSVPVVVPAEQESVEEELLLSLVVVSVLDSGGELEGGGVVVGPFSVLDSGGELDEGGSGPSSSLGSGPSPCLGGVLQLCRNGIGIQGKWKDGRCGQCQRISRIFGNFQTTIPPPQPEHQITGTMVVELLASVVVSQALVVRPLTVMSSVETPSGKVVIVAVMEVVRESSVSDGSVVVEVGRRGSPTSAAVWEVDEGAGNVTPNSVEEVLDVIGNGKPIVDVESEVDEGTGSVIPTPVEEVPDVTGSPSTVVEEESEVDDGIGNVLHTPVEDVLDAIGDRSSVVDNESVGTPLVIVDEGIDTVVSPVDSDGMSLVISDTELDAVVSPVVDVDSDDVSLVSADDGFVVAVVSVTEGEATRLDVVVFSVIDGDPGEVDVVNPSLVGIDSDGVLLGLGGVDPSLNDDDSGGMLLDVVDEEVGAVDSPAEVELADVATGVEPIEFESVELGCPVLPSVSDGVVLVIVVVKLGEVAAVDPEFEVEIDVFGLSGLDCWVLEAGGKVVDATDVGEELLDSLLELDPSLLTVVVLDIPLSLEDTVEVGTPLEGTESEGLLLEVDCETDDADAPVAEVDSDTVLSETDSDDGVAGPLVNEVESDGAVLVIDCETEVAGTPMDGVESDTELPEIVSDIDGVGTSEIEVESDMVLLELGSSVDDIGTLETEVESNEVLPESAGVLVGTPEFTLVGV
jgi:hypothetical protein